MQTPTTPVANSTKKKGNLKKDESTEDPSIRSGANSKIEDIIKMIETNDPKGQRVDLWWRQLGRKILKPLILSLANNTVLRELDLSGNKLRKEGAKLLAKSLVNNKTLTCLSLHNNEIGKEGAKAMAGLLKVNNTLRCLLLGGNAIGKDGVEYMLPVLNSSSTLESLSLASNEIKSKGAESLAKLIQFNRSLTFLDISSNDLSNAGAKAVFLALKTNEKLLFLNISYNEKGLPIARVGLKAINELLVRNRSLLPPNAFPGKLTPLELASPLSFSSVSQISSSSFPTTTSSSLSGTPSSPRSVGATAWITPSSSPRGGSGNQRPHATISNSIGNYPNTPLRKDASATDFYSSQQSSSAREEFNSESNQEAVSSEPKVFTGSSSATAAGSSRNRKKTTTPKVTRIKWNEYTQILGPHKISAPLNDTKRTASIRMTDKLTADQITHLAQIANSTTADDNGEKDDSE